MGHANAEASQRQASQTGPSEDCVEAEARVTRVLWVEGAANAALLILKLGVGIATGAVAIIADAVHSASDLANNGLALWANSASRAPADRDHPYGHHKYETLAVFGLAVLLSVVAVELALHALRWEAHAVANSDVGLIIMIGVLAINIALALWEGGWARRLQSELLLADAQHTLADVLTSVCVIAGWQLSSLGYHWLDHTLTLAISAFILSLAYRLIRRAIPVLVDQMAEDPEAVAAEVMKVRGVRSARRIRSRGAGGAKVIDVVVAVAPELSTARSHAIADRIEKDLRTRFAAADVNVHIEPDH